MANPPDLYNQILKKSFDLFKVYGHKSVSMDDVASTLHISKKTLYQYFQSKDELLAAGVMQLIKALMEDFDHIMNSAEQPLVKLSKIYWRILHEFYNMELVHIYSINKFNSKALEQIVTFHDKLYSQFTAPLLSEAMNQGGLRKDLNIALFVKTRLTNIDQHYLNLAGQSPNLSFNEIFKHLVVYQMLGVISEKYRKEYEEKMDSWIA